MHHIRIRFDCGHLLTLRKPKRTLLISKIVTHSRCPHCNPEILEKICGGCLIPFSVVREHSHKLCNVCVVRQLRYTRALHTEPVS